MFVYLKVSYQIRSSVFPVSSGQMLLCTEWEINKLSEYSKKYIYMKKTASKAENKVDFIGDIRVRIK